MKNNLIASAVTAALAMTALPAQAMVVTFGGQTATDGSGVTSSLISSGNMMNPTSGFFVETFDVATYVPLPAAQIGIGGPGTAGTTAPVVVNGPGNADILITQNQGCSINAWGGPAITTTGGGFAVRKGSVGGVAAAPAGDTTCYGFGPTPGGGTPATVKVNYAPILAPGARIDYLGIYYGSIDLYNNIAFYKADGNLLLGAGVLADGVLTGQEILSSQGGASGNQFQAGSNVYVNLSFAANEAFSAFEFRTTGVAFELDNIVAHLTATNIPEPGSLALAGLGLLGMSALRRRKAIKG